MQIKIWGEKRHYNPNLRPEVHDLPFPLPNLCKPKPDQIFRLFIWLSFCKSLYLLWHVHQPLRFQQCGDTHTGSVRHYLKHFALEADLSSLRDKSRLQISRFAGSLSKCVQNVELWNTNLHHWLNWQCCGGSVLSPSHMADVYVTSTICGLWSCRSWMFPYCLSDILNFHLWPWVSAQRGEEGVREKWRDGWWVMKGKKRGLLSHRVEADSVLLH